MAASNISARKLPHNLEAEQAVLGCVLIDQEAPVSILNELSANDFYTESHKNIFSAMKNVYLRNAPIDYVTLSDELESQGLLESVGGISYLSTLTNIVPSAANFKHYQDIVKRNSIMRKLINSSQKIIDRAYESQEGDDVLSFAEAEIYGVAESTDRSNLVPIKDSLVDVMEKFNKLVKDPDALQGIPTGFHALDHITNGFQRGDLILLAARPGFGKTSLAMNIVTNAAIKYGKSCAIFSLEMPKVQLAQRALCSVANVSMKKALKGDLNEKEWRRILGRMKDLGEANLYIDDSSMNTPAEILSKCRRLQREKGLDILMIDYLQLMNSGGSTDNRQQEIATITRNLKIMAKELNVPLILLSQLSRAVESRTDHRPMLSDLRESGAIEQDADIVLFIYKSEKYTDVDASEQEEGIAELLIAKHRNGETGKIRLAWNGATTTFGNLDSDSNRASLEETAPPLDIDEQAFDNAVADNFVDNMVEVNEEIPFEPSDVPYNSDEVPYDEVDVPFDVNDVPPEENEPVPLDDIDLSKIF